MGNWNITIEGVGCHHNKNHPNDANRMAAEFVAKLKAAGHSISSASIMYGGKDDISDPVQYADDRDAMDGKPESERALRCGKDCQHEGQPDKCARPTGHIGGCYGRPKVLRDGVWRDL